MQSLSNYINERALSKFVADKCIPLRDGDENSLLWYFVDAENSYIQIYVNSRSAESIGIVSVKKQVYMPMSNATVRNGLGVGLLHAIMDVCDKPEKYLQRYTKWRNSKDI